MKRLYPPLVLFLLLVMEGVALKLLPAELVMGNSLIIPHWVLIYLVFLAVFYDEENTYFSVLYGAVFGLLIDVVYTGILGVYMFSYAGAVFVIYGLKRMLHDNLFATLLLGFAGIILADVMIHIIYMVVGITSIPWDNYLAFRLLPTVLANLLFLLVLYPMFRNQLIKWRRERLNRNHPL